MQSDEHFSANSIFFLIPGNDFADHWEKYPWTSEWSYPVEIYSLTSSLHHFDGIRIYFVSKFLRLCVLIQKICYQATKREEFVSDKRYNKSIKSQNGNYTIEVLCVVFRIQLLNNMLGLTLVGPAPLLSVVALGSGSQKHKEKHSQKGKCCIKWWIALQMIRNIDLLNKWPSHQLQNGLIFCEH